MWAGVAVVGTAAVAYGAFRWYQGGEGEEKAKRPAYVPAAIDFTTEGLVKEMEETRSKPTMQLPVGVDLPRLCRKFVLIDNSQEKFSVQEEDSSEKGTIEYMRRIIEELCVMTGEDVGVMDKYDLAQAGELSLHLNAFLCEELHEEHRALKVLKLCNQSLLAPSVVRLKMSFGRQFSYKDDRGKWQIRVEKMADGSFEVAHRKREISYEAEEVAARQHFSFEWELRMSLDASLARLRAVEVLVHDVTFVDTAPSEARSEVLAALAGSCPFVRMAL